MSTKFTAMSAKLKAMNAEHLTEQEYDQLLEKHTVGEICAYLKQTAYRSVTAELNDRSVHRGKLEECLERRNREDYFKLYVFADSDARKLIRFFFVRDEITVLKEVLKHCFNNEHGVLPYVDEIKGEFFDKHSGIDVPLLLQSTNVSSVAEACRNTDFYPVLSHARSNESGYPAIAMSLDRLYFHKLWKAIGKYAPKPQQAALKNYIGTQIDYMNIMWIYRCKKYFRISNELIYTYLIPIYFRLSKDDIISMIEAPTEAALENIISSGKYSDILLNSEGNLFIEQNYKKIRFKNAKKAYKLHPGTLTEVFAFFDMRLAETKNLETVIEAVRYHTDAEQTKKLINI